MLAPSGGAPLEDQSLSLLRGQLGSIILGTVFLFFGLAACATAAIRRRSEVRLLVWLGIWSGMYGARELAGTPAVLAALPHSLQMSIPYVSNAIMYLLVVAGLLALSELTVGKMRFFAQIMALPGLALGLTGIGWFAATGSAYTFLPYNNLLVACALLVLTIVVIVPKLSSRFLVFPNRVLTAGTLCFAIEALYANVSTLLNLPSLPTIASDLGFAVFLFSLAYVAAQRVFASERRLLSIESELEVARQIQSAILPASIPEVKNLSIAASYQPMTAVAGDFYEFIQTDQHHVGVLVADVSGHGVPAALVASMIKMAVQSVVPCAHDPREVLRKLNHILFGQLGGQFATAAYLWVDMEIPRALYSAAGHPPLLCWRDGELKRIESNGPLFGFVADTDYPVCDVPLCPGDRLLLYTDGLIEPENRAGESFGERKLEQVLCNNQLRPPVDFLAQLLTEIASWQPASVTQQDDITLVVIDVI